MEMRIAGKAILVRCKMFEYGPKESLTVLVVPWPSMTQNRTYS